MIKLVELWTRRPDMTHDEAVDYWINKHGPLVMNNVPFVEKYIANEGLNFDTRGWSKEEAPPFDGMAEFWMNINKEALVKSINSEKYYETLVPDERKFIGTVRAMLVREVVLKG